MLTLNLIRHAKTNQNSPSGKDFDRELYPKGIAQANLLGMHLNSHHINLGKILCSKAIRTKQTQSILNQHTTISTNTVFLDELYLAGSMELLTLIEEHGDKHEVISIIGHNEGISELAGYLADEYIVLRTCELITIQFSITAWNELSRGIGMITLQYRPEVYLP